MPMMRQHDRTLRTLLLLTDILLCEAVAVLVAVLRHGALASSMVEWLPLWAATTFFAAVGLSLPLTLRSLSDEPSNRLQDAGTMARNVAISGFVAGAVVAAVAFALRIQIGPTLLFVSMGAQMVCIGSLRLGIIFSLRTLRRSGRNYRDVIVIGSGPRAAELTETVANYPEWGLRIVGYVDDGDYMADARIPTDRIFKLAEFPNLLRDQVIDEVMVASPRSMLACLGPAVSACSAAGVPFTLMTDLFGDYLPPPRVRRFASHEALTFAPVHHSSAQLTVKRGIDIAGAFVGLVLTAPVLLAASLAVKATSRGPVFFKQIRCGLNGRTFPMYKLRTMVSDAEQRREELLHLNEMEGPVFKILRDPRITPVGRLLRAFSIDELPQLWSVLIGHMSLVGPRPPIPSEVAQYETQERRRLSMRPGLTCLWQVSGRNQVAFDEWVKLDLQYIDTWSLWTDAKILALTVPTVLRATGS